MEDPLVIPVEEVDGIWKLFFDGACSKEGVGDGVVLISPTKKKFICPTNLSLRPQIMWMNMRPWS
jgi:hypothetical protein